MWWKARGSKGIVHERLGCHAEGLGFYLDVMGEKGTGPYRISSEAMQSD